MDLQRDAGRALKNAKHFLGKSAVAADGCYGKGKSKRKRSERGASSALYGALSEDRFGTARISSTEGAGGCEANPRLSILAFFFFFLTIFSISFFNFSNFGGQEAWGELLLSSF